MAQNMNIFEFKTITRSPEETKELGRKIGESCQGGEVFLLNGDLGAGKTCFTQGLAKGLGIEEDVTSPTFVLHVQYEGHRLELNHFDAYRLAEADTIGDLGFEDYFGYEQGVAIVEWPEVIENMLPRKGAVRVEIISLAATEREFTFTVSDKYGLEAVSHLSLTR